METARQYLEAFIEELQKENPKYEDVYHLLTKTQQQESTYIGRTSVHASLNVIHQLARNAKITIQEKYDTNELATDFELTFKKAAFIKGGKAIYAIRLIKEKSLRKPSKEGTWGVNTSSFKLLK